jgi:hypothetical protein
MRHESVLQHLVTISKEYRRAINPKSYLEDLLATCALPVKKVVYEDVFIPVDVDDGSIQTIEYGGKLCKAVLRASVLIEGEYSLDEIEAAFGNNQEKITAFVEYFYEG